MADSNSFVTPYEILPIAPENKYLSKFSYFIMVPKMFEPLRIDCFMKASLGANAVVFNEASLYNNLSYLLDFHSFPKIPLF